MIVDAVINVRTDRRVWSAPTARFDEADFPGANRFLSEHIRWPFHRLAVVGEPGDPVVAELAPFIAAHYRRIGIEAETLMQRAVVWADHYLQTLMRRPPWATRAAARPLAGLPVFVVAAGPSLDRNGRLLAKARTRGPVFAVNTSLSACRHHGIEPDVVVCVESKDVSAMFDDSPDGLCVVDAAAHPHNWAAATHPGETPIGIYSHEPSFIPYGMEMGVRPLNYGGSVACAAVSLALYWGASQVVLVGQDLAFTGGRMYAEGTPFSDVTVEHDGGTGMLVFGGESKKLQPQPAVMRAAWGGGEVASGHGMDSFCEWFAKTAERHCIINATEGGARIPGTLELGLAHVLDGLPRRTESWATKLATSIELVGDEAHERVRARLLAEAEAVIRGDKHASESPLLNMWTVPAILTARTAGLGFLEGRELVRQQLEVGTRKIIEALS